MLALISLINCNLIIKDHKGLFFSLKLFQSSCKSTKSMEPCVPSPNDKHRASSFWPQQNPIDRVPEKAKTVVPLKYLLILPPFSKQMPSPCCLFIFKSVWLFVLTLLALCRSRKAWCRLHPLSHSHQEGLGGELPLLFYKSALGVGIYIHKGAVLLPHKDRFY